MNINSNIYEEIIQVLLNLVKIPSFSGEEALAADYLEDYLKVKGLAVDRIHNNLMARARKEHGGKPVLLLNSHLDTVKVADGWSLEPFAASRKEGKIYGLGSNDATGPLVALLGCFLMLLEEEQLTYEPVFLASAEEEISGKKGICAVLPSLGPVALGIVGEPTGMKMAVAEKGLMVVDAYCRGKAAHAASGAGINAIYRAMEITGTIRGMTWDRHSEWLGETFCQVTMIRGGTQHNVVPDSCHLVVDVRVNEQYSNKEVLDILLETTGIEMKARSMHLEPSFISLEHPVVKKGKSMGLDLYGSGTLSDQVLMPFDSLKIGPGNPERSHRADEFIYEEEVAKAITSYYELLKDIKLPA